MDMMRLHSLVTYRDLKYPLDLLLKYQVTDLVGKMITTLSGWMVYGKNVLNQCTPVELLMMVMVNIIMLH